MAKKRIRYEVDIDTREATRDMDRLTGAAKRTDRAVEDIDESTGRAKDTMGGFVGDSVAEMPALQGALGGATESTTQLVEQLVLGEDALGEIVKFAAPMGAVVLAMAAYNDYKQQAAAVEAFKAENIEAYNEALEDTNSLYDAVVTKIEDAGTVQANFFGEAMDIVPGLNKMGISVEQFSEVVAGGYESIEAWADMMKEAGADGKELAFVTEVMTQEYEALAEAERLAAENTAFLGTEQEKLQRAVDRTRARLREYAAAGREIPESITTEIYTALDEGDLDEVNRILREIDERRIDVTVGLTGPGAPFAGGSDFFFNRGGPTGSTVGIAGEAGPELVNGQLVTGPTAVGPGSWVTSTAQTARMLRSLGYGAGNGGVGNVTINAGAGMSPDDLFDLANRFRQRNGRNPTSAGWR